MAGLTLITALTRGDIVALDGGDRGLVDAVLPEPEANCMCVYFYDRNTMGFPFDHRLTVVGHKGWFGRLLHRFV